MRAHSHTHPQIIALSNWIYSRVLIIELISVFVMLIALLHNMKTEADHSSLSIIPVVFLGIVYYLLRYSNIASEGMGKILLVLSSFASLTGVLALIIKYMAWPAYDILLISAGISLLASIIVIGFMRYHGSSHKILTAELLVRIYLLSILNAVLYLVPNSQLVELGFGVVG